MSDQTINNKDLVKVILESLRYMPFVYSEIQNITDNERNTTTNVYYVKHKADKIDANMIMFFLPTENGRQTNYIKILSPTDGYDLTKAKKYKILVETINGQYSQDTEHSIKPGRLIMFRLGSQPTSTKAGTIIIINDPNKGAVVASSLTVNGTASFGTWPTVGTNNLRLVDITEFNNLKERVQKLEEKIIVGTEDPAQVLQDQPEGTIYLQVDNYGNEDQ